MAVTFKSLSFISERLIKALSNEGFISCTKIQEKAIPAISKNKSILALAPTGTGKTLAYLVPIFNDIDLSLGLQNIIVVPTAALGNQIYKEFQRIKKAENMDISITLLKNDSDLTSYKTSAHVLIVTPTIFDRLTEEYNIKNLKRIIVDEADMIAFDGFDESLFNIKNNFDIPISLFSATLNEHEVTQLSKLMKFDNIIDVRENNLTSENVSHYMVNIKHFSSYEALTKLLEYINPYKTIVFVSNKENLNKLSKELYKDGVDHILLHGDLKPREAKNAINDFKFNKSYLLLSSDVGARGLDIDDVDTIISIDLPKDLSYYYHRAGRTGRYHNKGNSYVFYKEGDTKAEALINKKIKFEYLSLNREGLKKETRLSIKTSNTKPKNEKLEQEIKRVVRKTRSTKVKPNYKKKVKKAVERVKQNHKEKIIRTNIRKKNSDNK